MGSASLINGSIGVMVAFAAMPIGMLITIRMAVALVVLATPLVVLGRWREIVRPGLPVAQLVAVGIFMALSMLFNFVAIRYAGVASAVFLAYLAPVYIGAATPLILRTRTEGVVWAALAVALIGLAAVVLPTALADARHFSLLGIGAGVGTGVCFAMVMMLTKWLRSRVPSHTIVLSQCVWTIMLMLPVGLYQVLTSAYSFTNSDVLMAVLLGVLTTALSFMLVVHGMRYITVQQAGILGFLEPVSAALYAFVLLGQRPSGWTVLGGALLIGAGTVVVLFGKSEAELRR